MKNQANNKSEKLGENPPVLTGGLKPKEPMINDVGCLYNVGFDWFTVTVGKEGIKRLLAMSKFFEHGRPIKGFAKSEQRISSDFICWRKMHPAQPEKVLGFDKNYESWEFVSLSAAFIIPQLTDVECKPTRIDIAFDTQVADDFMADHLIESVRPHVHSKGISLGISGQGGIHTHYVGSPHSDKRIRIYRKDFQDIAVAKIYRSVLRVELILKGGHAIAFWRVICNSLQQAYQTAAAYIEEMTGLALIPENLAILPKIEKKIPSQLSKRLYHFIKQYGVFHWALDAGGVNLKSLVNLKYQTSLKSKVSRLRIRRLEHELKTTDINTLEMIVRSAIGGGYDSES